VSQTKLVIPIEFIRESDAAQVGNKACSLGRMWRTGFRVPEGFCITSAGYSEHLSQAGVRARVETALGRLDSSEAREKAGILSDIRQAITEAAIADSLQQEVEDAYKSLGAERVAVRSSATAEDLPEHSFAGLYDSFLNITNFADAVEAVKKCWASLWTERAYEYREQNGFEHLSVKMAVVIQRLIDADASGVIFTADPVYGYRSRIILEACAGPGDLLVSGKVTPDRFVIGRKKCRILARNSTCEPCISDSMARRLAKLGKRVDESFGCPQDIEWAVCENKAYLLQSRPITTVPREKSWEERQVWTNANTGEVAPDVVTPVTWSMLQEHTRGMLKPLVKLIAVRLGEKHVFGLVAGRVYHNLNVSIALAGHFPCLMTPQADSMFGGEHGKMWDVVVRNTPDENLPDLHFSRWKTIVKAPVSFVRILLYTANRARRFVGNIGVEGRRLQKLDSACLSERELAEKITWSALKNTDYTGLMFVAHGMVSFTILDGLCRRWFGEDGRAIANRLFVGLSGIDNAEAGLALRRLALEADESTGLREAILCGGDWEDTRNRIAAAGEGEAFLKSWDEFMFSHGHHCRGEVELFNARWSERPDYILNVVRSYTGRMGQTRRPDASKELAREREELTSRCRKQLTNPLKRWIFDLLLKTAQQGLVLRENWKSETVRYLTAVRRMLIELGRKLAEKGVVENADDVFFLKLEELAPVSAGRAGFDVRSVVSERRSEYEENKSVTPAKVVIGKFEPDDFNADAACGDVTVLNGLGVSSGVATGKARVILRADEDAQVQPGEILVAPFTDPGWTPYFVAAAGIVMDLGGLLSHGSIIAREYGICAVVNVGSATRIIKTGQMIRVDGDRGTVVILG